MWIRRDDAFQPIVESELFRQAEAISAARICSYSDEDLLQYLRDFLKEHGKLTERSIDACWHMPSPEVYNARFGGLIEAYRRIGYQLSRSYSHIERDRKLLPIRREFVEAVVRELSDAGASVRRNARPKLLVIGGAITVRVMVARCRPLNHSHRWLLRLNSPLKPDISVVARLIPGNESILDYFCFPRSAKYNRHVMLAAANSSEIDIYRFTDLTFLTDMLTSNRERARLPR